MLLQTRGIVLQSIPYADNKTIVRVYTEQLGLQSYVVNISRSKTAKIKAVVFQPLNQVMLEVKHDEKKHLHSIREAVVSPVYTTIHRDIIKTTILLFLAELLNKTLRHEEPDEQLYVFVSSALHMFDLKDEGSANFHLVFMLQLTRYLGCYPQAQEESRLQWFDLKEGVFTTNPPKHPLHLRPQEAEQLSRLMNFGFDAMEDLRMTGAERRLLLQHLLSYYELHIPGFSGMTAHTILETVLS